MMLLITVVLLMVSALEANRCPEFCAGIYNDADESCNRATLACLDGCKEGYYGKTCSSTCDVNCLSRSCQQQDGACICRSGYSSMMGKCQRTEGTTCKLEYHCKESICKAVGRKQCVYGCVAGWFGEFCDRKCTDTCVCDQISGACTDCVTGWYGAECGSRCSSGCVGGNCNRNGNCIQGCKSGSYGESCMLQCSQHCMSDCDKLSGECVQCETGRYGSTCQCSERCAGSKADCDKDGRCIRGCIKGYYGEKCESDCQQCYDGSCYQHETCRACKNGLFGTSCNQTCLGCTEGICDVSTGECLKGCQSGYYGFSCNQECEKCNAGDCDRKTGECPGTWMPYIIGGGGFFLLFIVLAVFMACCLKRMRDIVKDGVDKIGQNTAVQFVPGHGNQLRSIEIGSAETNSFGTNPDDIYNHLFDIKPIETTFSLAVDDLETSSGYCAVRPLFRGCSGIHDIDNGSDDASDGGRNIGRSLISLCDENGSDGQDMKMDEAKVTDEEDQNPKPFQIVVLQPDEEERISETIHVVTLPSDEEHLIQERTQIAVMASKEEGACGGEQMEEEETTDGCPTVDVGKHEEEEDDMSAAKINNNGLNIGEGDSKNDEMSIQPPDKELTMTPKGQHTKKYVEVKVMKQF